MSRFGHAELARSNVVPDDFTLPGSDWAYAKTDEVRWSQSFPYQLALYKKDLQGNWARQSNAIFTLPIPPTDISRSTPTAITTTVTLGGIIEEHNGSPLRSLTFNGTTGVLPIRIAANPTPPLPLVAAIFAGTIQGVNGIAQSLTNVIRGSTANFSSNLVQDAAFADGGTLSKSSGYYQFLLLEKFFDYYLALKKTDAGRNIVMAVEIHKEQAIFLVTPENFGMHRSGASPLEYEYSLSFKVWRRIVDTTNTALVTPPNNVTREPNALAALLSRVTAARGTLVAVKRTLTAVSADVNAVLFEPVRQISMFCKDALGVALTAADLPANIVQNMKGAILEASGIPSTVAATFSAFSNLPVIISNEISAAQSAFKEFSIISGKSATLNGSQSGLDSAATLRTSPEPGNKILSDPAAYYDTFSQIVPSTLNLTADVQNAIQRERIRIRELTRLDFQNIRNNLDVFAANFADAVGYGDNTYNTAFGRPETTTTRTPTTDDLIVLDSLNDLILELNKLVASPDSRIIPDPISYVAGLATPFGIQINIPNSKLAVPMPYGSTLEMVAARYLNNPDRWLEIAILNNLEEPYIDEVGFDIPLAVNGYDNIVVISSTDANAANLYVGQSVSLISSAVLRDFRTIAAIVEIDDTLAIQLSERDTDQNLNVFQTADHAILHSYLPNTVNSQQVIFIPSDKPADQIAINGAPNEALANFQQQLQQGGADILLTSTNDLAITPDGDCKLAIGMANLIQRIRLVIQTPIGSLIREPQYGFPLTIGQSVVDFSAEDILQIVQNLFQDDDSFDGVTGVEVVRDGPSVTIKMTVVVAGSHEHLPLAFSIS